MVAIASQSGEGAVNRALREHVTSVGFSLNLGKTHIAYLVWLDTESHGRRNFPPGHSIWKRFITGIHGCEDRGLIEDTPQGRRLTEAGEAVKILLLEAGIWQEYVEALPPLRAVA